MKIETFKQAQRIFTAKRQLEVRLDEVRKSGLQAELITDIVSAYEKAINNLQQQFEELEDKQWAVIWTFT